MSGKVCIPVFSGLFGHVSWAGGYKSGFTVGLQK